MTPSVGRRRPAWAAAVIAAVGLCLTAAGLALLGYPMSVQAESFGAAPAGPAQRAEPSGPTGPTAARPDPGTGARPPAPVSPGASAPATTGASAPATTGASAPATPPPSRPGPHPTAALAAPPRVVAFPGHDVAAGLVPVGVLPGGTLQVPVEPRRVGWWAGGAVPGQVRGSAVLAGHMAGPRHGSAMRVLLAVHPGDRVETTDSAGVVRGFRIVERYPVVKERLDPDLFTRAGPHRLVLITCGGPYDPERGYRDNVVVTAVPAD